MFRWCCRRLRSQAEEGHALPLPGEEVQPGSRAAAAAEDGLYGEAPQQSPPKPLLEEESKGNKELHKSGSTAKTAEEKTFEGVPSRKSLLTLIAKKSLPSASASEGDAGASSEGRVAASKTVTILYSSDNGHAEECAKAVARQCRNGGYAGSAVRCGTMDSFDVGALTAETLVVFCVATAGKGEFCGNGRNFFQKLSDLSDLALNDLKYCIFGLGDSHYWGKGTEESKFNFAKPARDLDTMLEKMGAQRMMPTGFGDDQDVDQYHTGFAEWKGQLFSRLGVDKADAAGGGDDGSVKTDEQIKVASSSWRWSFCAQTESSVTSDNDVEECSEHPGLTEMLGAVVAVREGCLWSHIQLVTGRPKLCTSGFSFWAVECQRGHGLFSSRKTVSEDGFLLMQKQPGKKEQDYITQTQVVTFWLAPPHLRQTVVENLSEALTTIESKKEPWRLSPLMLRPCGCGSSEGMLCTGVPIMAYQLMTGGQILQLDVSNTLPCELLDACEKEGFVQLTADAVFQRLHSELAGSDSPSPPGLQS